MKLEIVPGIHVRKCSSCTLTDPYPVQAYDPATNTKTTQTVEHVWVHQDSDLLDVTLTINTSTAPVPAATSRKQQDTAVASHGAQAPPATQSETIHTTFSHPWLTTDRGFVTAGALVLGERVQRLDGTTATVVGVRLVAGVATMYDLTVSVVHTFAVGSWQAVVHNCSASFLKACKTKASDITTEEGAQVVTHATRHLEGTFIREGATLEERAALLQTASRSKVR